MLLIYANDSSSMPSIFNDHFNWNFCPFQNRAIPLKIYIYIYYFKKATFSECEKPSIKNLLSCKNTQIK